MERAPQILVCDDDTVFHLAIKHALKNRFGVRSAFHGDEALVIVRNHPIDVLLLDVRMRSSDEGLRYIEKLKEADPELAIIMTSGLTDFQTVREAMRKGATDYIPKDFDPEDLALTISQALEKRSLVRRTKQQNFEAVTNQKRHVLVGDSDSIRALRRIIDKVRGSGANVVITGETGTGKEVIARQLRRELPDGTLEPFVAVDSSTIQSSMAESILFGHERGAFTGADRSAPGIFEEAHGGIVYFDEIGNMPLEIQAKLLRVLQEKEVSRLGSTKLISLDFRVVCATNNDLEWMAESGRFKADLLQRLNVLPIRVPPLRERIADIPLLLAHFLAAQGRCDSRFTEAAVSALQAYPWPGNVRELGNLVAYVVAMFEGSEVNVIDLPPKVRERASARIATNATSRDGAAGPGFYERLEAFERDILSAEYSQHGGNISRLALSLGMDRSHLYTKLKQHGLHPAQSARDPRA